MAKEVQLKDRITGESIYPITDISCVHGLENLSLEQLTQLTPLSSDTDLDTITTPGNYLYVEYIEDAATHYAPSLLQVAQISDYAIAQFQHSFVTGITRIRTVYIDEYGGSTSWLEYNAIPDNSITTDKLVDGAVTTNKLANGAITETLLSTELKNKIKGLYKVYNLNNIGTGPRWLRIAELVSNSTGIFCINNIYGTVSNSPIIFTIGSGYRTSALANITQIGGTNNYIKKVRYVSSSNNDKTYLDIYLNDAENKRNDLYVYFNGIGVTLLDTPVVNEIPEGYNEKLVQEFTNGIAAKEVFANKVSIKNGTSSQFLKGDGSVDDTEYLSEISNGSITTDKLASKSVAEEKLSDDLKSKLLPTQGTEGQVLKMVNNTPTWTSESFDTTTLESIHAYGVEWDTSVADPHLTRIGNMYLHKTLPIQSQLKGCIAQGDTIMYWLDENDWRIKKDSKNEVSCSAVTHPNKHTLTLYDFTALDYSLTTFESLKGKIVEFDLIWEGTTFASNLKGLASFNLTGSEDAIDYSYTITLLDEFDTTDIEGEIMASVKASYDPSRLDGYDGTVRVSCPDFYFKSKVMGSKRLVWLSTVKIDDTWTYVPACLIDAYRSTVLTTVPEDMGYLSTLPANSAVSIKNTALYCRGGNNNISFDSYLDTDIFRTQLGKPRTSISRASMRTYSRNADSEMLNYNQYKAIFYWLYVVEYANFNCQEAFNNALTADGYKQGGMGSGVTSISDEYWNKYSRYSPLIPCGYCDDLGNGTGIKTAILPSITVTSADTTSMNYNKATYTENSVTKNVWEYTVLGGSMFITKVNKSDTYGIYTSRQNQSGETVYEVRGLSAGQSLIFYKGSTILGTASEDGYITIDWGDDDTARRIRASFTGECNIELNIYSASQVDYSINGYTFQVPRWRGFDNPFGDIWTNLDGVIIRGNAPDYTTATVYTTDNADDYGDTLEYLEKMTPAGIEIKQDGYIKSFDLGSKAEIIPSAVGAASTTHKCDYHAQGAKDESLRTLLVGGGAHYGTYAGLGSFHANGSVSYSYARIGFRSVSLVS